MFNKKEVTGKHFLTGKRIKQGSNLYLLKLNVAADELRLRRYDYKIN